MNSEKLKEQLADIIEQKDKTSYDRAEEILNLKCPECGGGGLIFPCNEAANRNPGCPTCKGTGYLAEHREEK